MRILGIDPGFSLCGFGILEKKMRVQLIDCGILKMSPNLPISERILLFYSFFSEKIISYGITHIALETPFLGKNAQNFLKLGYLRGVIYLMAAQKSLITQDFTPTQIKLAVTGYGGADKAQVARVICSLFPDIFFGKHFDVTDAIAVALCCSWRLGAINCVA